MQNNYFHVKELFPCKWSTFTLIICSVYNIFKQFTLVSAIKAQSKPVTAPDTEEARKAVDNLQASIAGYFTRQRTKLKEARKDLKVDSCTRLCVGVWL